ncbi:MAG: hypothetical protein ACXQT6_00485 [Candidatus Methanospirareceae archaeon]
MAEGGDGVMAGGEGDGRKRRGRLSISRIMSKVAKGLPLTEREEEALGRYLRRVR